MRRLFVEAGGFRKRVDALGGFSLLASIQSEILSRPDIGTIVQALRGVRKMRMPDVERGKGKRGDFGCCTWTCRPEKKPTYYGSTARMNLKISLRMNER